MITEEYTTYTLNNFVIYEINSNELVLMHNYGIVKIKEARLIEEIKKWDNNNIKSVHEKELMDVFQEDYSNAISFLENNYIFITKEEVNFSIEKCVFLSNNDEILKVSREFLFENQNMKNSIINLNEQSNSTLLSEKNSNTLYVVFMNPYSKEIASKITSLVRRSQNSILLMSYTYNNNFYIDSLYSPQASNPCHFCHIGHIESQLRVDSTGNISYQQIIDSIYKDEPKFKVHTPLNKNNILNILSLLSNKISKYFALENGRIIHNEELHECSVFDLQTNNYYTDYSLHWELCDCYEK
ncbi:McbB family protein [Paenibacillus xylanexedens]|uniref:McbB family protein n=1 Tax=Paenibacillus xylanexedens TaxID=528191 RepID=UPI003B023664